MIAKMVSRREPSSLHFEMPGAAVVEDCTQAAATEQWTMYSILGEGKHIPDPDLAGIEKIEGKSLRHQQGYRWCSIIFTFPKNEENSSIFAKDAVQPPLGTFFSRCF